MLRLGRVPFELYVARRVDAEPSGSRPKLEVAWTASIREHLEKPGFAIWMATAWVCSMDSGPGEYQRQQVGPYLG